MFTLSRQCAESKFQWFPRISWIAARFFIQFVVNIPLINTICRTYFNWCQTKATVKVQMVKFCIHSISSKPLEGLSCNFGVQLNRVIQIPPTSDGRSRSRSYLEVWWFLLSLLLILLTKLLTKSYSFIISFFPNKCAYIDPLSGALFIIISLFWWKIEKAQWMHQGWKYLYLQIWCTTVLSSLRTLMHNILILVLFSVRTTKQKTTATYRFERVLFAKI